jgi:Oxidoreductase family, NAD-binding Rossmann fold
VKQVGIIGLSEGNGHPFSFGSIINGFSPEGLSVSGWPGIYEYVRRRHPSEFGLNGWKITHAWTQDPESTGRLCAACNISHSVRDYREFLGNVDAVIIARDDYETHFEMARLFLEAGLPVFVDKPLSLDLAELTAFKPYLQTGQLMSCSGMRYARELDEPRANLSAYGRLKLIRGAIVLSWEKYGVHLLDAAFGITSARPVSVRMLPAEHAFAAVRLDDGTLVQIDALGECAPTFHLELFGTQRNSAFDITDNFSMFRRMLWEFLTSIDTGRAAIPSEKTLDVMRVLIAGRISRSEDREVLLDEIAL